MLHLYVQKCSFVLRVVSFLLNGLPAAVVYFVAKSPSFGQVAYLERNRTA